VCFSGKTRRKLIVSVFSVDISVVTNGFSQSLTSPPKQTMVLKKLDNRLKVLIENGIQLGHRSMFVIVGRKAKDQVCGDDCDG
jgi:hypothetical protein